MSKSDSTVEIGVGSSAVPDRSRGGRPRDPGRDAAIVAAALEVLAETGYERMTMAEVAARAGAGKATLYRRWPSKAELIIHAVHHLHEEPTVETLPDTGTLRGDLTALMQPQSAAESAHLLAITGGLGSLLSADRELADAASAALIGPFVASQRILMERARDRGEIDADTDIETLAFVTPSMTAYRLMVQRQPIDVDFVLRLVDTVLLPALGLAEGQPVRQVSDAVESTVLTSG